MYWEGKHITCTKCAKLCLSLCRRGTVLLSLILLCNCDLFVFLQREYHSRKSPGTAPAPAPTWRNIPKSQSSSALDMADSASSVWVKVHPSHVGKISFIFYPPPPPPPYGFQMNLTKKKTVVASSDA